MDIGGISMAAARKQIICLQTVLKVNYANKPLQPQFNCSCLSYQQRRFKRFYNPREKPQTQPWQVEQQPDPVLYDPLTEESRHILEDEFAKKHADVSPLRVQQAPRNHWTRDTRRVGVLAVKIGKQPLWKKDGTKIFCNVLQVLDNHVIKYIPPEIYQTYPSFHPKWLDHRGNWGAAVVGAISCNPWNLHEDYVSLFNKSGVPPKKKLTRFMVTPDAAPSPGTPLTVNHFNIGDYVDCSARTIDWGFQGVMKRWGFSGQPASHGHTKSHRRPGSSSSGRASGIWKGSKMPGIKGDSWSVSKGLKIWRINTRYNVMYVTFGVPGPLHGFVRVYDSSLHKHIRNRERNAGALAMPTRYPDDYDTPLPEDIYDDEIFQMDSPSITFAEES